ncbi:ATP-binding cassette domain-containing protein [Corynebacterium sp. HS2168-gen11]|uniref:ATP-binding cassette domain-containing protein n=1 Tax=Corynebacterium sp. HS2168-gen11 TaxID=2974027 RepID=UPI00216ACF39|nr:ATP-binding cassette domain-containing protein [Corynebacterium sp. HS2168-gen11]MCS4535508.1 ATP-binding cassette domain-containing protein [Corynebacterium sp. HS2168-gen11]
MEIISLSGVSKTYGQFTALQNINLSIAAGQVWCVLGDNGAGKSTLIKILAGLHAPSSGTMRIDGAPVVLQSPREALDAGIATVYQDLALVDALSIWRNFFLGQELTGRFGVLRTAEMKRIATEQLQHLGIDIRDIETPVSQLSGGQRQVIAIARAIYFGARVVILDEPTAALGVKQSEMVLQFITAAKQQGVAVVFITHNPRHAYQVGDYFTVLNHGEQLMVAARDEVSLPVLTEQMAGVR